MENLDNLNKQLTIDNIIDTLKDKLSSDNDINSKIKDIQNDNSLGSLDLHKIVETLNNSGLINKDKIFKTNNNMPDLSGFNLDMDIIMKIQRILSALNKADPRKNLLSSLKPFLRQTRQKNVDNYISIIGILGALGSFSDEG